MHYERVTVDGRLGQIAAEGYCYREFSVGMVHILSLEFGSLNAIFWCCSNLESRLLSGTSCDRDLRGRQTRDRRQLRSIFRDYPGNLESQLPLACRVTHRATGSGRGLELWQKKLQVLSQKRVIEQTEARKPILSQNPGVLLSRRPSEALRLLPVWMLPGGVSREAFG